MWGSLRKIQWGWACVKIVEQMGKLIQKIG
jgi:hypothetical protein